MKSAPLALEEMSFYGVCYFELWRPCCSAERNHFNNFSRGSSKKHFCEIILKSANWPWRRGCLKSFPILALMAILFGEAKPS